MYTCYLIDIYYIHSTRSHLGPSDPGAFGGHHEVRHFCLDLFRFNKFLFGIEPFVSIESIEISVWDFLFRGISVSVGLFCEGSSTMKLLSTARMVEYLSIVGRWVRF